MVTYATCFVLLLFIALGTYVYVYNMFVDRCMEDNIDAVARGLDLLSDDIDRFSLLISQQRTVPDFARISSLTHPFAPRHLFWLDSAQQRLTQSIKSMALSESVLDCVLVYQNGACITLPRTYEYLREYYGTFFHYEGMDLEAWRTVLTDCTNGGRVILGQRPAYATEKGSFQALTVVQAVSYYSGRDVTNLAFLLLDSEAMLRALVTPDIVDVCSITMIDRDQILASIDAPLGSAYRTIESHSARLPGISVRVDIPLSVIIQQLHPLIMIFAVSVGLYLLAGISLTMWFSHRNSLPIRSIIEFLHPVSNGKMQQNEYVFVEGEIRRMDGDLKRTRQTLIAREAAIRAAAVERLMCGAAFVKHEIDIASVLFQEFPAQYCLCLLRVHSEQDDPVTTEAMLEQHLSAILMCLHGCFGRPIEAHCAGGNTLLFALPIHRDASSPSAYVATLNSLCEHIYTEYDLRAVVAVSDTFSGIRSLSQACNQARQILRVLPSSASKTVLRADLPEVSALVPVEYTDSQRFYEMLFSGDEFGAVNMIHDAFAIVRGAVDGDVIAQVFYAFRRVFDRISFELRGCFPETAPRLEYLDTASVDELIEALTGYVREISVSILESRERREKQFDQVILAYIDARVCEVDLCARAVGEHFSIPERAVQAIVRRTENVGFFEYVENQRMTRARDMILSTSLPISDIALSCGFALPNSFYKAFKRRFDVSPSALRESSTKKKDLPSSV